MERQALHHGNDSTISPHAVPAHVNAYCDADVEAGAGSRGSTEVRDFLLMAYDPSPWKSEIYLAVTKKVPAARNVALTGTFFSRVFDGPYNAVPKWIREMDAQIAGQGETAKKHYVHFTTCPKYAETYGHNYAVALAQVE